MSHLVRDNAKSDALGRQRDELFLSKWMFPDVTRATIHVSEHYPVTTSRLQLIIEFLINALYLALSSLTKFRHVILCQCSKASSMILCSRRAQIIMVDFGGFEERVDRNLDEYSYS